METLEIIVEDEGEKIFKIYFPFQWIYDFSSSLDLFELEAEIIENSREENGKIIISVEKFNELFSETEKIYQAHGMKRTFTFKKIRLTKKISLQSIVVYYK
ncbi:hypothetical protein EfmAA610_05490 [Enterococcus faecium]|nr:hypothetical protein EfmAA610_05490 [Enterococcus faecium]